jgi:myo-inositol-1(or 4)-monophosphatase
MSESDLGLARRLASEAGGILRTAAFRAHPTESKQAGSPPALPLAPLAQGGSAGIDLVTIWDRRAESIVVGGIREARPDDQILAEEGGTSGATASKRRWLIDPLDGTTNFSHGLPFFTVSVALELAGELEVGVVQAPALAWSFWAVRGGGAYWNGRLLSVSQTGSLAAALLATGFPYDRQTSPVNNFAEFIALKKRAHGVRRVGAASLDLAMVAAGWIDGYWEQKLKAWDLAAGALLVREAGGRVTGWQGADFVPDHGAAVATNGHIHKELLDALASA